MASRKGTPRVISLGDDFGPAVVEGITVELSNNGDVTVHTNGNVKLRPASNNHAKPENAEPKIGDRMADGTVYSGVSPDSGKAMYAMPKDAPLTMKWKAAMEYAAKLDAHAHHDWRVPTKGELNVMFQNRAAIGGFDDRYGSGPTGWYWSSLEDYIIGAWAQQFNDGHQSVDVMYFASALRCVR